MGREVRIGSISFPNSYFSSSLRPDLCEIQTLLGWHLGWERRLRVAPDILREVFPRKRGSLFLLDGNLQVRKGLQIALYCNRLDRSFYVVLFAPQLLPSRCR